MNLSSTFVWFSKITWRMFLFCKHGKKNYLIQTTVISQQSICMFVVLSLSVHYIIFEKNRCLNIIFYIFQTDRSSVRQFGAVFEREKNIWFGNRQNSMTARSTAAQTLSLKLARIDGIVMSKPSADALQNCSPSPFQSITLSVGVKHVLNWLITQCIYAYASLRL